MYWQQDFAYKEMLVTVCLSGFLVIKLKLKEKQKLLTNANNFLNFDAGGVNLFGKLTDGLVWVLVGKGVHIYPYAWGKKFERKEGMKRQKKEKVSKTWKLIHSGNCAPSVLYFYHAAGYTALFCRTSPPPPFFASHL